jgi:hypothetical protein
MSWALQLLSWPLVVCWLLEPDLVQKVVLELHHRHRPVDPVVGYPVG